MLLALSQIEWRPFQKEILKIVRGKADDRAIYWLYSIEGDMSKSMLVKHLVDQYEALKINTQAAKVPEASSAAVRVDAGKRRQDKNTKRSRSIRRLPRCRRRRRRR